MATTRFYLDMRGKAKDGKGSILIILSHNYTNTSFSTGVRVSKEEWNGSSVINKVNSDDLNVKIMKMKQEVDKKILFLSMKTSIDNLSALDIKNSIIETKNKKKNDSKSVVDLFREYMDSDMSPGTKKIYESTLLKILSFAGPSLNIDEIDLKWIRQFEKFLSKTQGVNGRAIYLRNLRTICNYALHTNRITVYPFKNFSIKTEPTTKRSITVEKLREFAQVKVTERQSMFRDYFFLMFYLIGINAVDLLTAKKSSVVKGRLEYTRTKTHKKYSIKIEPEANELIKRYSGKNYLIDALDHCVHYQDFLHMMNDSLQEIGNVSWEMIPNPDNLFEAPKLEKHIEPIIPGLTTYFARHTWATFAYEIGIPFDVISQALGHSFGNRTTLIYIKSNPEKVDQANRKVIDYFLGK